MTSPFLVSTDTGPTSGSAAPPRLSDVLVRRVEAVQHPHEAVEAVVCGLVEHGLAVAHLAILPGTSWIAAAATSEQAPLPPDLCSVARPQAHALREVIGAGTTQRWVLPTDNAGRQRLLSLVFGDTSMVEQIDAVASRELLFFPLHARDQGYGLLAVAFDGHAQVREDAVADLELIVERLEVSLDTCALLAEGRFLARTMREALIPRLPQLARTELGLWTRVADQGLGLGGDCVAVTGREDDLSIVVADAMGKGVEAAVTAKRLHAAFRTASRVDNRPRWVLDIVNQVAFDEPDEYAGFFTTAACARSRPQPDGSLLVDVATAGHCPPLLLRADGEVCTVSARGPVLGLYTDPEFTGVSLTLQPGDSLVLYTDGVTEAQSADDVFGEDRLEHEASSVAGMPAQAVADHIGAVVDGFADPLRDQDDRTVLVVRCPTAS